MVLWLHTFSQSKPNLLLSFPSPRAENRQKPNALWRGGGKRVKEGDQYEDKACKTLLEMNRGKGERMMEEMGWICRLDESEDERQRKSTYDTQSLRNITLGLLGHHTPRVMISMRARRCVYERERERRCILGFQSPNLKPEEKYMLLKLNISETLHSMRGKHWLTPPLAHLLSKGLSKLKHT